MDQQDVAIQLVLRSLYMLGGALAFGLFATWFVGWLCRRASVPSGLTVLAQLATPVALFFAASFYLDVSGQVAQARVETTEERISHRMGGHIPGSWSRTFWATVAFDTAEGLRKAPLWINESTYDALLPGAPIAVRYLAWLPLIARPADQPTRTLVPWRWLAAGLLLLAAGLTIRPLLRRLPPVPRAVAILVGGGALVIWLVFPTPWVTPLDPPILTAEAEVLRVREETRSFVSGRTTGSVEAPQPWNIVELRFLPAGRKKPVTAVDSVDAGSVAGLQAGARLPVSYNASHPRDARLAGTRTWRRKEWGELGELAVLLVVVCGGFVMLGKVGSAWWRRMLRR